MYTIQRDSKAVLTVYAVLTNSATQKRPEDNRKQLKCITELYMKVLRHPGHVNLSSLERKETGLL